MKESVVFFCTYSLFNLWVSCSEEHFFFFDGFLSPLYVCQFVLNGFH